jgi:hypothetical protein
LGLWIFAVLYDGFIVYCLGFDVMLYRI